jgi:gas vesicle protein
MADGHDSYENEDGFGNESRGGSFVMGLLTGTVLGAGLGILFAPKAGAEIRNQISEKAGNLADSAADGYRRASETANELANKGVDMYGKAREAVVRGAEEAQHYVRDATSTVSAKAREAVAQGTEEAQQYVRDASNAGAKAKDAVARGAEDAQQFVRDATSPGSSVKSAPGPVPSGAGRGASSGRG